MKKYIANPNPVRRKKRTRSSKLDPYRDRIKAFVEQDPDVKAPVVLQRSIETTYHREQVKKLQRKLWLDKDITAFSSLGPEALEYLQALVDAKLPIKKNVSKLLSLKDEYGSASVIYAIKKALVHNAIGADYIENILYQEMTPRKNHSPVRLKNETLNKIRLPEPSLVEYDAHVLKKRKKNGLHFITSRRNF